MKLLLPLFFIAFAGHAQSTIVGKWKTVDDGTGETRSVVEIYEREGAFYGKVVKIFNEQDPDPICEKCDEGDPRYRKKIIGMEIIQNLKEKGGEFSEGTILDPEDGKVYRCKLWVDGKDLKVRGYWGFLYRTQTWIKGS